MSLQYIAYILILCYTFFRIERVSLMEKDRKVKQINENYEQDRVKIFIDGDTDELDKIAFKKVHYVNKFIVFYSVIFVAILICSIWQIYNYVEKKRTYEGFNKTVEISSRDSKLVIFNDNYVPSYKNAGIFNEDRTEATVQNVSRLELSLNKDLKSKVVYNYNVRYRIYDNLSKYSIDNNPSLLVKFSYSTDNKNWTYVNNVISTTNSTLMPLMGNYYDITGLETTLNVATNLEIAGKDETKTIYWRAETFYKCLDSVDSNLTLLNATFDVEYVY